MTPDQWEAKVLGAIHLEQCLALPTLPVNKHPVWIRRMELEREEEAQAYAEASCTCFLGHPPCGFCTDMTEEEVEVYYQGGAAAVHRLRETADG